MALVLTFSAGIAVYAADSPSGNKTENGIAIKDTFADSEDQAAVDACKENLESVLTDLGVTGKYQIVMAGDAYETGADNANGVIDQITVTESDKVVLLHYVDGSWVMENCQAGDGYVSFTLANAASPLVLLVKTGEEIKVEEDKSNETVFEKDSAENTEKTENVETTTENATITTTAETVSAGNVNSEKVSDENDSSDNGENAKTNEESPKINGENPKTGDTSLVIICVLVILCAGVLAVLIFKRIRADQ